MMLCGVDTSSGDKTHEVGQKRTNAFGSYDTLGNKPPALPEGGLLSAVVNLHTTNLHAR